MTDYTAQLEALKEITTMLQKKEDVPAELWAQGGVPPKSRVKDINKKIVDIKAAVKAQAKQAEAEEDEVGFDDEPKRPSAHRKDQREKKDVRRLGLDKKRREMDPGAGKLGGDTLYVGGDGMLNVMQGDDE